MLLLMKLRFRYITIFFLALTSCNQNSQNIALTNNTMKNDNYKAGDCFEFKEKIKDFGVIFLEEEVFPDGKEYKLFPIKLDTTRNGLDRFKYAKVYITGFSDFTKSTGRTEGFMVYHFLNQKDFQVINKFFSYVGAISIKEEYKNTIGGTIAANFDEFRTQLDLWDSMFGKDGRLVSVADISR